MIDAFLVTLRTWPIHHHLVHPACRMLRLVGLRRLSFRLHDASLPDHESSLWDVDYRISGRVADAPILKARPRP